MSSFTLHPQFISKILRQKEINSHNENIAPQNCEKDVTEGKNIKCKMSRKEARNIDRY